MFGYPSNNVLQYQITAALPQYFWHDRKEIGAYALCKGNKQNYDFYIIEIDVNLTKMSDGEKQERFGEARFAWGGDFNGRSYGYKPLKAETLVEAKAEVEAIYEKILVDAINAVKAGLDALVTEYAGFKEAQRRN